MQISYWSNTGQFPQASGPTPAKPSGERTPLGGFGLDPVTNCQIIPDGLAGGGLPNAGQRKEAYMRCKMGARRRCTF
jgi:hypothetical protein